MKKYNLGFISDENIYNHVKEMLNCIGLKLI